MVYYKSVKISIDAHRLAEVIMHIIMHHHGLLDLIVTDKFSIFTSKFWSLLCYLFSIKHQLFTTFYLQTDS